MSILTEAPPDFVYIRGQKIPINTDFRAGIKFEIMALEGGHSGNELLSVWFEPPLRDTRGALEAALWFYTCGADDPVRKAAEKTARIYDFERDAGLILAAFLSEYGIDLSTAKMHWWTFRALMLALPDDCLFKQAVYYRTVEPGAYSGEERRHIERLKRRFSLEKRREMTLEERDRRWRSYVEGRYGGYGI